MDKDNGSLGGSAIRKETEGPTFEAIHPERPPVRRNRDSISTVSSEPRPAGDPDKWSEKGVSNVSGGVNVKRAEADFAELNRELSRTSNLSRKISRVQSRKNDVLPDVEKAPASDDSSDEPFDLESALRGNRDEEEAAGIKSKRIGVVWEGLTVSGIGGVKNYVKTFPDAFVSFFNVFETVQTLLGLGRKGREFDILKNFKGVTKPGEMVLVLGKYVYRSHM
jgi:ATP-binding cassette, subfamily G (WHITE), member 2, SNQ2